MSSSAASKTPAPDAVVNPTPNEATISFGANQVYEFLKEYSARVGYMPSRREIAAFFKVGVGNAENRLRVLENHGLIRNQKTKARAITLVDPENVIIHVKKRMPGTHSGG